MTNPEYPDPFQAFLQENSRFLQNRLALNTVSYMRDSYRRYGSLAPDAPDEVRDFFRHSALQSFINHATIFSAGAKNIASVRGGHSDEAHLFVDSCARAYHYLITQENPDHWLSDFLEQNPLFTQDIGGIPDWLQEQSPK